MYTSRVVLEVLADTGQVVHHRDAERFEQIGGPDSRQLEQLGRIEGTAAEDDLGAADGLDPAAAPVLDADRPRTFEDHPVHLCPGDHVEIRTGEHGVEVRASSREPAAAADVLVERRETFLPVPVDVIGAPKPRLDAGVEPGLEQRVEGRPAFEFERAGVATPVVAAGEAGLHALEVGQAVGVRPVGHAGPGSPLLEVGRVAALEDHAVDRRRSAQHLAAGVVDPPTTHVRLGLRLVLPVVEPAADRVRQRGRHVDEDVPAPVGAAGLEHEHAVGGVGRQPVGQRTSGRTPAHDDEVVRHHHRRYRAAARAARPPA